MDRAGQYEKAELELMTTHQLREICRREKIINGIINPLDKEELVRTVMRYMGKQQTYLIRECCEGGEARLEEFLQKVRITYQSDSGVCCNSKILAYEGLAVTYRDGYTIPFRKELAGTNALLIGSDMALCAVLNLEESESDKERLYITKQADLGAKETRRKDYHIFCMPRRLSECIYHLYYNEHTILPEHIQIYSIPLIDFTVKKPMDMILPMAIDFGSVNTTAGVYLDGLEANYTIFGHGTEESVLLPSVIGVAAVEEADYRLLFGYDAVRLASASYIDEGFCVFYDIKRWIGECDKEEEIVDRQGRRRFVRRTELLRRFFLYVIRSTENQFKCRVKQVHISSPVKQKHAFREMFRAILPEYMADQDIMLDEGMAVLYNTVSRMIAKDTLEENKVYEALVIDCGGGTTDLCSYRFRIRNRQAAYQIYMETTYENGDTDFGGNNLTYRIMQLLKIALVCAQRGRDAAAAEDILKYMDTDIYRFIDTHGVKKFYEYLDEEYKRAEEILPTRFADFERYRRDEYYKVKNNFYTLFDAAERVKKLFFGRTGVLKATVAADLGKTEDADEKLVKVDKWKLSFREGQGLCVCSDLNKISLNYFDMELLLSGEIYATMQKFMEELYQSGRIQDFSFIKLTGQSCKIDLFKDALKEFVPGKMVQFRKRAGIDAADFELKMSCVDGALKYLRDKKYGLADIHLDNGKAVLPYRVMAHTHQGKEVTLVDGWSDWNRAGCVSRNMEDLILPLYLQDISGEERCLLQYVCRRQEFKQMSYEEIEKIYGEHIQQKETDTIGNGDVKFFVWAKQEEWGFQVVPVCCEEDMLYLGREEFFQFENGSWVNNFFDGEK